VQDLVEHHVRVRECVACNEGSVDRYCRGFEVRFDGLEVVSSRRLFVLRVGFVAVVVEEGLDEERAPCAISAFKSAFHPCQEVDRHTIGDDIANHIHEVLLLFVRAVILSQQPGKMSEDGIALRQDLAVELHDWDVGGGVQMGDFALFVFWVFVEGVAHVGVRYGGIFPEEANDSVGKRRRSVEVLSSGKKDRNWLL
jgi:hypothetical protein